MEKLDEKDRAILKCIMKDPRIILGDIPYALEQDDPKSVIPYPTVQRRVQQMTASRILNRGYITDWARMGYICRYRVGILIDSNALQNPKTDDQFKYDSQTELASYIRTVLPRSPKFSDNVAIDDVYILLGGQFDMTVDVFSQDDRIATQFIIEGLRNLRGIRDTSTEKVAYSSKFGWSGQ
jgi:DNA-binding Lrp family transcriptional regulator